VKRLYRFESNLSRKRCTKFYQNRPSFIGDITKNVLVSFFPGHIVLLDRSADSTELKIIVTDITEIFYWFLGVVYKFSFLLTY